MTQADIDRVALADVLAVLDAETGGSLPGPYLRRLAADVLTAVRRVDAEAGGITIKAA